MTGAPELVWDVQAQLGEGPVWSARECRFLPGRR